MAMEMEMNLHALYEMNVGRSQPCRAVPTLPYPPHRPNLRLPPHLKAALHLSIPPLIFSLIQNQTSSSSLRPSMHPRHVLSTRSKPATCSAHAHAHTHFSRVSTATPQPHRNTLHYTTLHYHILQISSPARRQPSNPAAWTLDTAADAGKASS